MQNSTVAPPPSAPGTATSLVPLLRALLRRRTPISQFEWLSVVTADAEAPGTWCDAFGSFSPDDQCHLLDVLLQPDSGSFADVLLVNLASNAERIADDQVRQTLLHEVGSAWERFGQKMQASAFHRDGLIADESALRERYGESLNLAKEIVRTESEVAALRAQEFEVDEEFTRLHALEREQREWERRRSVLSLFDVEQAQKQVAQLRAEMEQSERQRAELQQSLQSLQSQLAAIHPQVDELETQQSNLSKEVASLEQRRTTTEKSVVQTQATLAKAQADLASAQSRDTELQTTLRSVEAEVTALAHQGEQWTAQCARERSRLEQLKHHADAANRDDISAKITEVIRLLPNDRPDDLFTARRPKTR